VIVLEMMRSIGPSSALPHGIVIEMNWSFAVSVTVPDVRHMAHSVVRSWVILSGESAIVRVMPSMSHPSISLRVSHVPSAMSFLVDIAGPMVLPEMLGPGNMDSMACSRVRVTLRRWVGSVVWTRAMKSST
jgi:hypothetical protein